jgi:hypothetical protein
MSLRLNLEAKLRELSPVLIRELRLFVRHPRTLGNWIEGKSPWLNRRFLGVASNFAEPFLIGMGLHVERLTEEAVEVSMPGIWRNQGEGGVIHSSALSTAGELAARLYWEYHLDLQRAEMSVGRVQLKMISGARVTGDIKAIFRMSTGEREATLHRLRADGQVQVESQTLIYDRSERLVAEVDVDWTLRRQLALK